MTPEPRGGRRGDVAAAVDGLFWRPHANPRSVWGLVATYPVFVLAVYRRSRPLLAATLLSVLASLATVSPPETDEAWATRVVLGERVWLERGVTAETGALSLTAAGAAVNLYTLRAAATRRPGRTAVGTVASMALTLLFFDRMVGLYDAYGGTEPDGAAPVE
jgi:hypothetical protein